MGLNSNILHGVHLAVELVLATLAATAGALLASLIAYISQRQLVRGHHYLSLLATAPLAIPGIVLAVGLFAEVKLLAGHWLISQAIADEPEISGLPLAKAFRQ